MLQGSSDENGQVRGATLGGRLDWYANRLRAMDAREVLARARREALNRVDAGMWHVARSGWRRRWEPEWDRIKGTDLFDSEPLGFLDAGHAAVARTTAPEAVPGLIERATAVLAGRVRLFGYDEVQLEDPPDYLRDPFTGRRWPDAHGKLLDYRRTDGADPKWIWELNRCQELPLLCAAWRLGGDRGFAETAHARMLHWLRTSRPARGIAWSNGFEAGLRGTSFALTFDALRGTGLTAPDDARVVLRGLWQHARWIQHDRSIGSSANNHLIGEAAGLVAIGLLAPELADSEAWVAQGLAWLETEAERQILPDGAGAEQAFAYHLFVCDLLSLVAALLEARGRELPASIRAALCRSADALTLQVRAGEPDPAYGDADDGRAFVLDGEETRETSAVAATLACAVGHAQAAALAGRPDLPAALLFGAGGLQRFAADSADAPADGFLPDGGIVVLRRAGVRTLFDAGPLGYLGIAAHGHADALAVAVSDGANELVSDPGTGTYFGDRSLRHVLRSTAAHATISVDSGDQAVYGGPFLWLRHPTTSLRKVDLEAGYAIGETDAWQRLPDPVRHRRAVLMLSNGSVLVYDRLDARGAHRYAQSWPLHPSLDLRERSPSLFEAFSDGRSALLAAFAGSNPVVRHARGDDTVSGGWWSRKLERIEPACLVRVEQEQAGRAELLALLVPTRGNDRHPDPELRLVTEGAASLATFSSNGSAGREAWRVRFDLDDPDRPVHAEEAA